jgi:outer membrane protein TolC
MTETPAPARTLSTVDLSDAFLDEAASLRKTIRDSEAQVAETERHLKEYTRRRDLAREKLNQLIANGLPPAPAAMGG